MSACPELSLMYQHYNTEQNTLETLSQQHLRRSIPPVESLTQPLSQSYNNQINNDTKRSEYVIQYMNHMNAPPIYDRQYSAKNIHSRILPSPLSIVSTPSAIKTTSSSSHYTTGNNSSAYAARSNSQSSWNITWLVFMNEKWVPFDVANQVKLEQTLTVRGTFVDISDSHFPGVKRVRVFPRNYYLSYLGVKYRLSRVMQPDAYLDHVSVAQVKQQQILRPMSEDDNRLKNRVWEMQ